MPSSPAITSPAATSLTLLLPSDNLHSFSIPKIRPIRSRSGQIGSQSSLRPPPQLLFISLSPDQTSIQLQPTSTALLHPLWCPRGLRGAFVGFPVPTPTIVTGSFPEPSSTSVSPVVFATTIGSKDRRRRRAVTIVTPGATLVAN